MSSSTPVIPLHEAPPADAAEAILDRVFFALSDPLRRKILDRIERGPLLVSEIAAPFEISLQAVSRHIQVLVRAGLVSQERTGRISRCSLEVGPIFGAAIWINRYTKYWQAQFEMLAAWLDTIEEERGGPLPRPARKPRRNPAGETKEKQP